VTKEVTKVQTQVPPSCLDALDAADGLFLLTGEAFTYASDAMGGAANLDAGAIEDATAGIESLKPKMQAGSENYQSTRDACRKSAEAQQ
jgi:hypothetical protein